MGRFSKLKWSTCNVPFDLADITNVLPCGGDSNGSIVLKFILKVSHCRSVYFEAVPPGTIHHALLYLRPRYHWNFFSATNIALYSVVEIALDDTLNNKEPKYSDCLKEDENPLNLSRFNSQESFIVSHCWIWQNLS